MLVRAHWLLSGSSIFQLVATKYVETREKNSNALHKMVSAATTFGWLFVYIYTPKFHAHYLWLAESIYTNPR